MRHPTAFNRRLSQSLSRTFRDLSEGVFVMLGNTVLLRRDSFLDYIKPGLKPDTWASLRSAPLHLDTLFLDESLSKAEREIQSFEDRRAASQGRPAQPQKQQNHQGNRYQPYNKGKPKREPQKEDTAYWRQLDKPKPQQSRPQSYVQKPVKGNKNRK